jgi:hypothetical protein
VKRRRGSQARTFPAGHTGLEEAAPRSDPAASQRLAAFLDRLGRVDREDLQRMGLPPPDQGRQGARERAMDAAVAAGRGELLKAATERVRKGTLEEYSRAGYRPTWLGLNGAVSTGRAEDRVAWVVALEDAAIATVAEDLLSGGDVAELMWPFERLAGQATGGPPPESLGFALGSRSGSVTAVVVLFLVIAPLAVAMFATGSPQGLLLGVAVFVGVLSSLRLRARRRSGGSEQTDTRS